mmetsp:Transcript_22043/g.42311  ORF Transcript_22043/g.42311 Transcript_22043/m.42311 type:complete len:228 (-) Transcript_22043:19-702(-)
MSSERYGVPRSARPSSGRFSQPPGGKSSLTLRWDEGRTSPGGPRAAAYEKPATSRASSAHSTNRRSAHGPEAVGFQSRRPYGSYASDDAGSGRFGASNGPHRSGRLDPRGDSRGYSRGDQHSKSGEYRSLRRSKDLKRRPASSGHPNGTRMSMDSSYRGSLQFSPQERVPKSSQTMLRRGSAASDVSSTYCGTYVTTSCTSSALRTPTPSECDSLPLGAEWHTVYFP